MEDDKLYEQLQDVGFKPFKDGVIENLTAREILGKDVFDCIFSIDEPIKRGQVILEFQTKAKELGVITPFKEILEECKKNYKKIKRIEEKQRENTKDLSHDEVAEKILSENELRVLYDDIYIYENGVYKNDKRILGNKIIKEVKKATIRFRSEVCEYLKLIATKANFDRENNVINFKNGLLDLKTGTLNEHTPDFFSINQINTNFNPNAEKVQAIDDVLDKLSNGVSERKQTILEMIGYSMTTSVKLQKAFILYGNMANNGKSTLLNIIDKLLGEENIGKVSFDDLTEEKFSASGIKGKILNTRAEMPNTYIRNVGKLKELIGGDSIEIEEKYKTKQIITPYAKYIFNANELPKVADKTNGFYRRFQIIMFEHSFTSKDLQAFDFNELVSQKALEYLAKISVEAFTNKGELFANSEESEKVINKYKKENNNVLLFLDDIDYIREFIEGNVSTKKAIDVYEYYKRYCRENGDMPVGSQKFYKEMEKSEFITKGKCQNWITFTFDKKHFCSN